MRVNKGGSWLLGEKSPTRGFSFRSLWKSAERSPGGFIGKGFQRGGVFHRSGAELGGALMWGSGGSFARRQRDKSGRAVPATKEIEITNKTP